MFLEVDASQCISSVALIKSHLDSGTLRVCVTLMLFYIPGSRALLILVSPTLLKMQCSVTPLGSPTFTVIKNIKGIL